MMKQHCARGGTQINNGDTICYSISKHMTKETLYNHCMHTYNEVVYTIETETELYNRLVPWGIASLQLTAYFCSTTKLSER